MADQSSGSPQEAPSVDPERQAMLATADLLANILDTTVKIPGTRLYLGLDPLLGLIPGIGDLLANLLGTVILGLAVRLQVPQIVLTRMSLNLLINGAVGAIPIFGDLFSVWFRSHARNAVLLREAATKPCRARDRDWLYVVGIIGGTVLILIAAIALVLWMVVKIWSAMAMHPGS
ncbi:MAG TPA: DUF4112 domain-containing protein [Nitrospira sp.]|nr:DUF4112 domain-containing protein [Nitrospira sp.]